MSTKIPSIISSLITLVLVVLIGVFLAFMQIILLNGFSSREGGPALAAGFTCLGIGAILSAILAWALAKVFISKFNWNNILAVFVSVLASSIFGGGLGFASIIITIAVASALWDAR
ncbi:MAG: hypothetical protein HYZ23_07560 [Chloroflexi bacterium]|nr:hypothetical protein [Chloroflexota bacterium]